MQLITHDTILCLGDDNVTENDVIGHSLSWSWEDNELSWSPTSSLENSEQAVERNEDRSHELTYRQKKSKPKHKRVKAKIWSPRFPGDKTADKSPSKNDSNSIFALPDVGFDADQTLNNQTITNHTSAVPQLHIPLGQYLPDSPSTTRENIEDFSPFTDYSLPPVSSLFGAQSESEPSSSNTSLGENNYFVNDVITPEPDDDYSFQTTLDAFLWNPKELLSPSQPSNCSSMSLSVK